jgi:AbrB family looped-hinge helix DNA binding protein
VPWWPQTGMPIRRRVVSVTFRVPASSATGSGCGVRSSQIPPSAVWTKVGQEESTPGCYYEDMTLTGHRRRPHLTTLAIRRKGIVTIPEAIREELDLHEGDHLVATVEDGRLVLIPASVIPDDQAWFWTPEWQAKEAEADQEITDGGGPVMSADEFISELAQRAGLSADDLT